MRLPGTAHWCLFGAELIAVGHCLLILSAAVVEPDHFRTSCHLIWPLTNSDVSKPIQIRLRNSKYSAVEYNISGHWISLEAYDIGQVANGGQ